MGLPTSVTQFHELARSGGLMQKEGGWAGLGCQRVECQQL